MNRYAVSERFVALQGEGVHAGTMMAFIRLTGCSVGKNICTACDTDFDQMNPWYGGGLLSSQDLWDFIADSKCMHVCFTGGEPLDHASKLIEDFGTDGKYGHTIHVETSGTVIVDVPARWWVCVSPKPGWKPEMIKRANELKVIVPGLGPGKWPDLNQALAWATAQPNVFIQPRNFKNTIDKTNLHLCLDIVRQYPQLHLSVQMHKFLGER